MAIHSSVLAWRIPGTGEPGGLPSMGSHRVGHDWSDLATAAVSNQFMWITLLSFLFSLTSICFLFVLFPLSQIYFNSVSGMFGNSHWLNETHWKRLWCWEGLGAEGEGDDRGWDGWIASLTRWTWVWVNSGSWWCTGWPGVLWFMGSQRVRYDWATELNWTELNWNETTSILGFVFFFFRNNFSHMTYLLSRSIMSDSMQPYGL